jgi:hypothetical protein
VEAYYIQSVWGLVQRATQVLTPVGDNGPEALELGSPLRKGRKLQALEPRWNCVRHDGKQGSVFRGRVCAGGGVMERQAVATIGADVGSLRFSR